MTENLAIIHDAATNQWLSFENPLEVVVAREADQVLPAIRRVEEMVENRGLWAAGCISYEASPGFDPAMEVLPAGAFPLVWFGIYKKPRAMALPPPKSPEAAPKTWTPCISRGQFDTAIDSIKDYIRRGHTYQVNYTFRMHAPFEADPWELFLLLQKAQQCQYGAFVDTGRFAVCSASPELFYTQDHSVITSRPMKGTAGRGLTLAQDEQRARWLHESAKNRAENVMIVDMIRNDMGRVARTDTVRVPKLFNVERYPTVFQMTSTVTAQTDSGLTGVLSALFPCASITGAPKVNTMAIIAELETSPRGLYTGSVGFVAPNRRTQFNVAIRTVVVDRREKQAEYGVGGGILWYSDTAEEFEECKIKARVLTRRRPDFDLLETLLWTPEKGWFLLHRHLSRLGKTALYFGVPLRMDKVRKKLVDLAAGFPRGPMRVRVLVSQQGEVALQAFPYDGPGPTPVPLALAREPVRSTNPFLYHKTTLRKVYEQAARFAPEGGEVLLYNEKNELTEAITSNVVLESPDGLFTPPVECGLLAGTFRQELLESGQVKEKIILVDELPRYQKIYLVNSVREWREARLVEAGGKDQT